MLSKAKAPMSESTPVRSLPSMDRRRFLGIGLGLAVRTSPGLARVGLLDSHTREGMILCVDPCV